MIVIYQNLGLGHIKRCQVLIDYLKIKAKFITVEDFLINKINSNFYLIDAYNFPEEEEKILYQKSKIIVISDYPTRFRYCNYLLDYSTNDKNEYNNLIPKSCKLFLGLSYFPINKKFIKNGWKYRNKNKKLLITFGGLDPNNFLLLIFKKYKLELIQFNIRVIIGSNYKHLNEFKTFLKDYSGTIQLKKSNKLWEEYIWCDWCIGAFGVSCYERLWMGVPSLNIKIAENQQNNKSYFIKNNLYLNFDINNFLKNKYEIYKKTHNHFKNHHLDKINLF